MSKCEIEIEFDHGDRVYHGGGLVRGTVVVHTLEDTQCNALKLEAFWETHGRGNIDRGNVAQDILFEGEWRAGDNYRYPFEFVAPIFPPTLRGNSLHVDHYVKATADVPWAFDPKAKQDYILLSSDQPGEVHASSTREEPGKSSDSLGSQDARPILIFVILAMIGLVLPRPVGLVVIAISAIFGIRKARRIKTVRRLGKVRTSVKPFTVLTGGMVALDVTLRPGKNIDIEEIRVALRETEVTVSGSGTNESTHRKVISDTYQVIGKSIKLAAGKEFHLEHVIEIPADALHSFYSEHNQLIWSLSLQIRQPGLPKWGREWVLCILPHPWESWITPVDAAAEESEEANDALESDIAEEAMLGANPSPPPLPKEIESAQAENTPDPVGSHDGPQELEFEEVLEEPQELPAELPEAVPEEVEVSVPEEPMLAPTGSGFEAIYTSIVALDRFGDERKQRIAQEVGSEHAFDLVLERVKWTYGDVGEVFKQGRSLEVKLESGGQSLLIHLPKILNESADALKPGARLRVRAVLTTWNSTYGHPEFESEAFELLPAAP